MIKRILFLIGIVPSLILGYFIAFSIGVVLLPYGIIYWVLTGTLINIPDPSIIWLWLPKKLYTWALTKKEK